MPVPPSSLVRTPRLKYNSNFVSKLREIFESYPEADLAPQTSKYSTKRLNELRGMSLL
jgi:hypothetical protein